MIYLLLLITIIIIILIYIVLSETPITENFNNNKSSEKNLQLWDTMFNESILKKINNIEKYNPIPNEPTIIYNYKNKLNQDVLKQTAPVF